jgi:hypothetical protein
MATRKSSSRQTWFAVLYTNMVYVLDAFPELAGLCTNMGYVLDVYPEERAKYRRELGRHLLGEYQTEAEALAALNVPPEGHRRP